MPRDLIPANLPVFYQCMALPAHWEAGVAPKRKQRLGFIPLSDMVKATPPALEQSLLKVTHIARGKPTFFDPKQKRNEFFRLRTGDTAQLVSFLNTVGLFESEASLFNVTGITNDDSDVTKAITKTAGGEYYSVSYHQLHRAERIWGLRDSLVNWFESGAEFGAVSDFPARILRENKAPKVVITTATLLDAVLLSIITDRVKKAKVQKCARPDCGIVFTSDTRHKKKYCCRYCAHVESVRRDRERKKL